MVINCNYRSYRAIPFDHSLQYASPPFASLPVVALVKRNSALRASPYTFRNRIITERERESQRVSIEYSKFIDRVGGKLNGRSVSRRDGRLTRVRTRAARNSRPARVTSENDTSGESISFSVIFPANRYTYIYIHSYIIRTISRFAGNKEEERVTKYSELEKRRKRMVA